MSLIKMETAVLKSPSMIFGLVLSLTWIMLDYSNRFDFSINVSNEEQSQEEPKNVGTLTMSLSEKTAIENLYKSYQKEEQGVTSSTEKGLSREEQLSQTGFLDVVYVGDKKLSLKAVFDNIDESNEIRSALVEVKDLKSGMQSIEKVVNGGEIYDFLVSIKNNKELVLSRLINEKTQTITLKMYKKR